MAGETRIWRETESDRCGFCGHVHALDIEYRCVGCDREICALCLVTVETRHTGFCPECASSWPDGPADEG